MSKRGRVQLHPDPATLRRWEARADALGLSVQLWATSVLDRASLGAMPSQQRAAEDWATRYLATLNLDSD